MAPLKRLKNYHPFGGNKAKAKNYYQAKKEKNRSR